MPAVVDDERVDNRRLEFHLTLVESGEQGRNQESGTSRRLEMLGSRVRSLRELRHQLDHSIGDGSVITVDGARQGDMVGQLEDLCTNQLYHVML